MLGYGDGLWELNPPLCARQCKVEAYHILMPVNLIAVSRSQGSNHEGIQTDAMHWYLGSTSPKALTMGIYRLFYPSLHSPLYYEAVWNVNDANKWGIPMLLQRKQCQCLLIFFPHCLIRFHQILAYVKVKIF